MNIFPIEDEDLGSNAEIIWLYGLSGAGKSTLAKLASIVLRNKGLRVYVLDGDNLRYGLNSDLGFTGADRNENIRRAGEVAKIVAGMCDVVICTFITPSFEVRVSLDTAMKGYNYKSIYVSAPISICEKRDTKGLYKKARRGEIPNFTGISSTFDKPNEKSKKVDCANQSESQSLKSLLTYIDSYSAT